MKPPVRMSYTPSYTSLFDPPLDSAQRSTLRVRGYLCLYLLLPPPPHPRPLYPPPQDRLQVYLCYSSVDRVVHVAVPSPGPTSMFTLRGSRSLDLDHGHLPDRGVLRRTHPFRSRARSHVPWLCPPVTTGLPTSTTRRTPSLVLCFVTRTYSRGSVEEVPEDDFSPGPRCLTVELSTVGSPRRCTNDEISVLSSTVQKWIYPQCLTLSGHVLSS